MRILNENDRLPLGSTVATIGMFDGVHLGHATLVDFLKRQADTLGKQSLVITFLRHPRQVLHPDEPFYLIMPTGDRLKHLEALNPDLLLTLDFTPELAQLDSSQFIELLRDRYGVDVLVAGYNHHFGHNRGGSFADYCRHGESLGVFCINFFLGSQVDGTDAGGLLLQESSLAAARALKRATAINILAAYSRNRGR